MPLTLLHTSSNLIADRRFAYGQDLAADGDMQAAAELYEQTLELVPDYSPAWFELGKAYTAFNSPKSEMAFQHYLNLDPNDTLGAGLYLSNSMSAAYITSLFDSYANKFDAHLIKALNYRGPEILHAGLKKFCTDQQRTFKFNTIIDLGCGTGLSGEKFTDITSQLIGCDLSTKMIKEAQRKNIYQELYVEDAITCLSRYTCDLILAVDVLVYIGDLFGLFAQIKTSLTQDGLFAFSVQSHEGTGYKLGEDMRYAHSYEYIANISKTFGLDVKWFDKISTRQDRGIDVPGSVVIVGH